MPWLSLIHISPFKPLALLNYPMIDEKLGQIAVDFWETTWPVSYTHLDVYKRQHQH